MNPVVIDASAGVELAADTLRRRALRVLLPADAVPSVPELFFPGAQPLCRSQAVRNHREQLHPRGVVNSPFVPVVVWCTRLEPHE